MNRKKEKQMKEGRVVTSSKDLPGMARAKADSKRQ